MTHAPLLSARPLVALPLTAFALVAALGAALPAAAQADSAPERTAAEERAPAPETDEPASPTHEASADETPAGEAPTDETPTDAPASTDAGASAPADAAPEAPAPSDGSEPAPVAPTPTARQAPPPAPDDAAPAPLGAPSEAAPDEVVEDRPLAPLPDDRPTTSLLAVTGQVATGAAACCCGLPLVAAVGLPLLIVPFAGPFLGPCALQGGFCATNAILGGAAEVFVGDALGPGHGALLPVIGAQAAAHLAASLVATVLGTVAMGTAVGFAAPRLPTEPAGAVAYLNNDPGFLAAAAFTVLVFAIAIGASLATGPIVYALTAVPKEGEGFQLPRWSKVQAPSSGSFTPRPTAPAQLGEDGAARY